MSVLSNFLRKRTEAKLASKIEKNEAEMEEWEAYSPVSEPPPTSGKPKPNDPAISTKKAAKETADLIPPWLISIACILIARATGVEVDVTEAVAVVGAITAIWKFCSKYYRDFTKPRFTGD